MRTMLTIGEVSRKAGVNVQTLRFYERRGLLKQPARTPSGYRQYGLEVVGVVQFIKQAQSLGFSLNEIAELLALRDGRSSSCGEVRAVADAKIADIEEKLAQLTAMRDALLALVSSCAKDDALDCPIIEALGSAPARKKHGQGWVAGVRS